MSNLGLTFVLGSTGAGGVARVFLDTTSFVKQLGAQARRTEEEHKRLEESIHKIGPAALKHMPAVIAKYKQLGDTLKGVTAQHVKLSAAMQTRSDARAGRAELRGEAMETAGLSLPLIGAGKVAARFEDKLRDIAITGEMVAKDEALLGQSIRRAALRYNQGADMTADGIAKLVAQGMSPERASVYSGVLSKTATATRADMGDLAGLVFTLESKFGLKGEKQIGDALNYLAKSGKLGQYELRDMARGFPEMGGQAASFGVKGMEGVKEMGLMMQVARAGAGTTGDADTYMRNWFSHMSAKSTQDHFEKVGINYEQAKLKLMIEQRVSAIEASFMVFDTYLDKVTSSGMVEIRDKKGKLKETLDVRAELAKANEIAQKEGLTGEALKERIMAAVNRMGLSTVLQDMQAVQMYLAYKSGKGRFEENRKTLNGPGVTETIDRDFEKRMEGTTEKFKMARLAVEEFGRTLGGHLLPLVGQAASVIGSVARGVTSFMQAWPNLTQGLAVGAVSLLAAKIGFITAGYGILLFKGALAGATLVFSRVAPVLGFAGRTAMWLGRGLLGLASLGGLAFVLLGTAAYLWYRRWRDIVGGAKLLWGDLTSFFKSLASRWVALGSALVDGLVNGIKARFDSIRQTVGDLAGVVRERFSSLLGIRSPSTVFMDFGANISDGAAIGIRKRLDAVKGAAGILAAATLVGAAGATSGAALAGSGAAGGITINFSPTIYAQDARGVTDALNTGQIEMEKMIRRVMAEQQRRSL